MTKEDIQAHFSKDGTGTITEVKLMNGFGFIEYDDPLDARDMVPGKSLQYHSRASSEGLANGLIAFRKLSSPVLSTNLTL